MLRIRRSGVQTHLSRRNVSGLQLKRLKRATSWTCVSNTWMTPSDIPSTVAEMKSRREIPPPQNCFNGAESTGVPPKQAEVEHIFDSCLKAFGVPLVFSDSENSRTKNNSAVFEGDTNYFDAFQRERGRSQGNICRSLFEKHKTLFSFLLCILNFPSVHGHFFYCHSCCTPWILHFAFLEGLNG